MPIENLNKLAELIRRESDTLLAEWRQEVRQLPIAEHLDVPTLNDHLLELLEELGCELEASSDETMIGAGLKECPVIHGLERLRSGFDIEEVVAEYNALRSIIQNLAERHGLSLHGKANHIVNRVIDGSIGLAVKTYATQKAVEVQQRREEHLSFVAHDLRTPLSAIATAAQLLGTNYTGGAKDEQAANLLEIVQRNVNRMNALVVKVVQEETNLKANAEGKLERREVKLRALVENLINDLQPLAGTLNTKLTNHISEELTAFADPNLLTLVFQNLISNAIKYTPNGEVSVRASEIKEGGAVECWVSDNGAGIPADRLEKVFEKLETDPDRKEGMGLGLAIVKQIVEAHDGQVSVTSQLGEGATFRFTLPHKASGNKEQR
ncbi:MAG: HAMP domain-containing histidine kinase [Acidobacteria bacterium]|nr:HAMP domain-containing histidine kinase [Acidobacteriota bacterium]